MQNTPKKILQQTPSVEQLMEIQKKLAVMVKLAKQEIAEKDKEIQNLKEKNKSLEKKNEEMLQNVALSTISDIKEIKSQVISEKALSKEIIKTLENEITKKNNLISTLTNELDDTRKELELSRKINLKYFDFKQENNSSSEKNNAELQLIKISKENTSLKTTVINHEETITKLKNENSSLKDLNEKQTKNYRENLILEKEKFDKLKTSYNNLIKEYLKLAENYKKSKEETKEMYNQKLNLEEEVDSYQKNFLKVEKQSTDITAENESMRRRIDTYSFENNTLKKEILKLEEEMNNFKMSKQIFAVSYYYMNIPMNGNITLEREGEKFSFIIENVSSSRILSFLDIELIQNKEEPIKFEIHFIKENTREEYISKETQRLIENFNIFKKRAIEVTDVSSQVKAQKETEEKVQKTEKQLNNFLGLI